MMLARQSGRAAKTTSIHNSSKKRVAWGMFSGLAATIVMDLILICAFWAAGLPAYTCFSIVGDTVGRLFAINLTNSAPLGAAAHYLIGPLLGAVFGAAGRAVPALQAGSRKKAVLIAVLYAEVVSQPLLALTPILLRMPVSEALLWYGGSLAMHMVWGCVLGAVWSKGKHFPAAAVGMPVRSLLRRPAGKP